MTKTTLLLMLLLGVIAAALVVLAAQVYVPNPPTPVDLKNAEIAMKDADIRLAEAHARLIQTKVRAKADLLRMQNQSKIDNDPAIVQAHIRAKRFWILWPFVTFYAAGCGAAAFVVYHAIRRVEFQAAGVQTFVTRKQAALLAEKALYLQGVTEQAKIAALTEQIGRERFAQGVSLFAALGRAWRSGANALQAALPEVSDVTPSQPVVSFADMLRADKFTHGKPLLFGFEKQTNAPRQGTWQDCYSLGIAGQSGFGKSASIRLIMAESLLTGAVGQFYIIDLHWPHERSLLASLGALKDAPQVDYARDKPDVMRILAAVNREIDERLAGKKPSEPVCVLIIDEVLAAAKLDGVADIMERIGTESRKAGVYGMFAAQSWVGAKTGGTTARDNLTAFLVHNMKRKQADCLLQDSDLAKQATKLKVGEALFLPAAGEPEILTIPFASKDDMREVVSRLTPQVDLRQANAAGVTNDAAARDVTPETATGASNVVNFAAARDSRLSRDTGVTANVTGCDRPETAGVTGCDSVLDAVRERIQRGAKMTDVSRDTGVDRSLLTNILQGKRKPSDAVLSKLTAWLTAGNHEVNA